jgi:small-conductance mechanosensitive channel
MHLFPYAIPVLGTAAIFLVGWIVTAIGHKWIAARNYGPKEHYRRDRLLNTAVLVVGALVFIGLWSKVFAHKGTFFGLLGAGLAVALREPLLSVAGRIAIFAGHIYTAGDRIEINKLSGDVIDIGFFYTRMMEIGNWISGDQYSGRIIQFANAQVFGTPVFNYTRNFAYIWDEIKFPITYDSNIKAATQIMESAGADYTRDFLKAAETQLQKMQHYFMVPRLDFEPHVFMKVTDNWVELVLRYLVEPKKRRQASTFLFQEIFRQIHNSTDISIASTSMEVTVHRAVSQTQERITDDHQQAA